MATASRFAADVLGRVQAAADTLLDVIFPPHCLGCGRPAAAFCSACMGSLRPVRPPWCSSCGRSIVVGTLCGDCRLDPLPLAGVRSAAQFDGPLRHAIHRMKYRGRTGAVRTLAGLLTAPARSLNPSLGPNPFVIVPIPLHAMRQRERGFNHAALLARPLAAALHLPYDSRAVSRVRDTPRQVGLSRVQRRLNLRDAFSARPTVTGKAVVLVDDVVTTGSTLASAAQACHAAGAAAVYAVTLARQGD